MNITAQHVAPEDVMALLDGELSAAEAKSLSAHIEDCAECTQVAQRLRRTSQALSSWKVSAIPANVEDSVADLAAKARSGVEIRKPKLFIRASFWGWKQWGFLTAGTISALAFLLAIIVPSSRSPQMLSGPGGPQAGPVARRGENETFDQFYSAKSQGKDGGVGSGVGGGAAQHRELPQRLEEQLPAAEKVETTDGPLAGDRLAFTAQSNGSIGKMQVRNGQPNRAAVQISTPMIARAASLAIVVKDFAAARALVDNILARHQGYSSQMNVNTAENAPRSLQASLRIPAPALSAAINDLRSLGRVERETQSGEDVTRQHTDLVARLKNSRDTEQRLRDILQKRTGKVSDVLEVEEEISRVRGEIEEMESEQKALEHRVDFATLELQLAEEYKAQLNPPAPSVATRIHNAFVAGYQKFTETMLGFFLFFAEYVPVLLIWLAILTLPFVLIWRRYRRIASSA